MPLYDYECEECGRKYEEFFPVDSFPEYIRCECGKSARKIISKPQDIKPDWEPYWDENLGDEPVLVTSRQHRRELMKQKNLEDQYHRKPGMPGQWI